MFVPKFVRMRLAINKHIGEKIIVSAYVAYRISNTNPGIGGKSRILNYTFMK